YWWDDSRRCLYAGATELWIRGQGYGFPVGDPQFGTLGLPILIDTAAAESIDPPFREVVHLTAAEETVDQLLGVAATRLAWAVEDALHYDHDLTGTRLAGHLLPATEGRRFTELFAIEPKGPGEHPPGATVRVGPDADCNDAVPIYLHTLSQGRLTWL